MKRMACAISLAILELPAVAQSSSPLPWQPSPAVDARGYIDVWRLRADVAYVEKLFSTGDTDQCSYEGDPDEHLSAEAIKKQQREESTCIRKIERAYKMYQEVHAALNQAWMPILKIAIQKGDPVAEVILRHCETTYVLDRSAIESTCDENAERRVIASQHLNRVGFLPATVIAPESFLNQGNSPVPTDWRIRFREANLAKIRGGALSFSGMLEYQGGNVAKTADDLDLYRLLFLIEAIQQDAPRAFTATPGRNGAGWRTEYSELKLVRHPNTPGDLSFGQMLHYGGSNSVYTGLNYWRTGIRIYAESLAFLYPRNILIAGEGNPSFVKARATLIDEIETSIDRYLAAEPRWNVFLLHRLGHHEWVPEGMQSRTHQINRDWQGRWALERESLDWSRPMENSKGHATISLDGEFTRISITADTAADPFLNVTGCLLRYSGGSTYLPKFEADGTPNSLNTILGYYYHEGGPHKDAVSPFNPNNRYKQVLMQCGNAENPDSIRTRFMLLAGDTLVEFGYPEKRPSKLAVRHYRRMRNDENAPLANGETKVSDSKAKAGNLKSTLWVPDANGCLAYDFDLAPGTRSATWKGACRNGYIEGPGTLELFIDGKPYKKIEGGFKTGKAEGRGISTAANGGRYEGEFSEGWYSGLGAFSNIKTDRTIDGNVGEFVYGDRYEGEFKDDTPNGQGQLTRESTGERYQGRFLYGCHETSKMKVWVMNTQEGCDFVR